MTVSDAEGFIAVMGRRTGVSSVHTPGTSVGYSDLSNARLILFWEVK
jgi:hypothetical protein